MKTFLSALLASSMLWAPAQAGTSPKYILKPGPATGYTSGGDFDTIIGPKVKSGVQKVLPRAVGAGKRSSFGAQAGRAH